MQRIQTFRMFESQVTLTEEQEAWLNEFTWGSWSLNPVGEVDVNGDFGCSEQGLKDFKGVKFGRVSGNFWCYGNKLTSLVGAPREVKGDFLCFNNLITSLAGAPQEVKGDFWCHDNSLTSLVGAPREVGVGFYCGNNSLTSLEGAPEKVVGTFYCSRNKITSLEGSPQEVGGDFRCHDNRLTSLVGAPQEVKGYFETDEFKIPKGQWGLKGWLYAYVTGNEKARNLLLTLIGPDAINRKMQEAPEQTVIDLGPVWNDPDFAEIRAQIRIPDRYRDEMGLLGDLGELGF